MSDPICKFLPLGAIIQSFHVNGRNIVQGFSEQAQYEKYNTPFYGETIGRVANRISGAMIEDLNGKTVRLAKNDGENTLHGGNMGWRKKAWDGPKAAAATQIPGVEKLVGGETVEFTFRDIDRNEGFPGTLDVSVVYTTGVQEMEDGRRVSVLGIEYQAMMAEDEEVQETVVNITNHSYRFRYFNLSDSPTIEGTVVSLSTDSHLPLDASWLPTSSPAPHGDITANKPFTLGVLEPRLNECFIITPLGQRIPLDTRSSPLQSLVSAYHPGTKLHLEVLSTEPAFQFYTGDYIDVKEIQGEHAVKERGPRSGFCVEPGRYVNAVNVPELRGQVLLRKGEKYGSQIVYRAWCDE